MITIHCDKCGKEMNPETDDRYRMELACNEGEYPYYQPKNFDLCTDCAEEVEKFITGVEK